MSSAIKCPCKICENNVTNSDQAIQCDLCDSWVHIKYNDLNYIDYKFLQNSNDPWLSISCCTEIFPFNTVKNKIFISNFYDSNKYKNIVDKNSSLLLKPSEHLKHLVNQFNNMSSPHHDINSDDPENTVLSKYYDIHELQNLKLTNKSNSISLLHINAGSLSKNCDDLQHLLCCTNKNFDFIAITETRITRNVSITNNNLNIKNYSTEFTPTESSAGGTLLLIANHLSQKPRQDLNICKKNELEPTFVEIMNQQKSNIIVGRIYKHPSMELTDFNSSFLNNILEKISKEQKSIFLLSDFNIKLLNYNVHNPTNEFMDSLAPYSFLPYILQPTRIISH